MNFPKINRLLEDNARHGKHPVLDIEIVDKDVYDQIIKERYVELNHFILMPNHFHIGVRETKKGGVQKYMQRVLNAYTKSFNTKYEKSGHVFQGPYKIVHVSTNEQLLYLSAYIHLNARELKEWRGQEDVYPYSSYQDYVHHNRWKDLLITDITKKQFPNEHAYYTFVEESGAKTQQDDWPTPDVGH